MLPSFGFSNSCSQKLERLGWTEGVTVAPYGVRVGVRTNSIEALQAVQKILLPAWERVHGGPVDRLFSLRLAPPGARAGVQHFHLLYDSILRVARTLESAKALQVLDTSLHLLIGATAREHVFVHAGVVSWEGKAIVVPGASMAGKSTLVNALVKAGATYYSDEYAVLDTHGRVHAYLKPLSLRGGQCVAPSVSGVANPPPIPVGTVLLTHFAPQCRSRPRALAGSKAALGLFANALAAALEPPRVMQYLGAALTSQPLCLKGPRGEAEEFARWLLRTVLATQRAG